MLLSSGALGHLRVLRTSARARLAPTVLGSTETYVLAANVINQRHIVSLIGAAAATSSTPAMLPVRLPRCVKSKPRSRCWGLDDVGRDMSGAARQGTLLMEQIGCWRAQCWSLDGETE